MCQLFKRFFNDAFTFVIKCACGLIKYKYRWILQKYSSNRQPLLLAARQLDSSLSDICIVSIWKLHDKVVCICQLRSFHNLFSCRIRLSISDVIIHCPCKKIYILLDYSYIFSKALKSYIPDVLSIYSDTSFCNFIKSWNKTAKCRFSTSGRTNQRHIRTGLNIQVNVPQNSVCSILIFERNIVKYYIALYILKRHCIRTILDVRLNRQYFHESFKT